ncbi:hypothetical protein FOQG_18723 [Fusarium oxysporum f. sp. raphani 54005]|uniref:Uncharacterized protein n=1 Tax=Fusarium oxysporum f. sp. raphani 54005 TaxID=1089458 RepID=X0BCI1_FUSOX|nr:hypothetical protein FOQG_18723 [Fusarium oxysporum f. sp. raphani 54005]
MPHLRGVDLRQRPARKENASRLLALHAAERRSVVQASNPPASSVYAHVSHVSTRLRLGRLRLRQIAWLCSIGDRSAWKNASRPHLNRIRKSHHLELAPWSNRRYQELYLP